MEKIKTLYYNWRQVGSTQERDGAGEDWERFTLGEKGVVLIEELFFEAIPNYCVHFEDGSYTKVFNPNQAIYFSAKEN
jgi:hypothetical protein